MLAVVREVCGERPPEGFLGILLEIAVYLLHEVGIVGDVSEGLHRELVVMGPVTLVGPLYFA